jgi:hypothetical protein
VSSAVLVGAIGGLWLWTITAAWPETPDGLLHLQRARALTEAWRLGVWVPRWFPDFAFGYGHPILHYYAPGAYVAPAVFHLIGLGVVAATRLWLALAYGLSAAVLMLALPPSFHAAAATTAGLLYLAYPYRLYDLFVRGALPEFAAFLWLPAILGGTIAVLTRPRWGLAGVGLALAWAGLVLTHNLTALMAALFTLAGLPLAALARPAKQSYSRRLVQAGLRLGLPGVIGALLSAFYWLPVVLESNWVGIGASGPARGYANHFAAWNRLFQSGWRYVYPPADQATVPLPDYLSLLAVIGALLLFSRRRRAATVAALTGLVVAASLTLDVSAPLWDATAPVMGKLQFPWRWQTMAALPCAMLAALGVQWIAERVRRWAWGVALAAGLLVCVCAWPGGWTATTPDISTQALWAWDAEHGQVGATWTGEFLPVWVQAPRWTIGRAPETPPAAIPAATLTARPTAVAYLEAAYAIITAQPQTVTLDRFYFPAWRVAVDGTLVATRPLGELGLLAFDLPPGEHRVTMDWAATRGVWIGRGLTALGWLAVVWVLRRRFRLLALWIGVVALALVGIAGLPARTATPQPIGADYGRVRLEAALTARGQVDLFWMVNDAPPDLTVFVHVTGPDGAVVAQWDEPLGGIYRPPSRQTPGLLLRQRVRVPLPADLPAGDYPVLVGLYAPGHADAPLIPADVDGPRVSAGTMTIQP